MEAGKGLKKATTKEECKVMIPSLNEEDGSIFINRERILERYAEFYEKLYEDTLQNIAKVETEEIPSILTSEVERFQRYAKVGNFNVKICLLHTCDITNDVSSQK